MEKSTLLNRTVNLVNELQMALYCHDWHLVSRIMRNVVLDGRHTSNIIFRVGLHLYAVDENFDENSFSEMTQFVNELRRHRSINIYELVLKSALILMWKYDLLEAVNLLQKQIKPSVSQKLSNLNVFYNKKLIMYTGLVNYALWIQTTEKVHAKRAIDYFESLHSTTFTDENCLIFTPFLLKYVHILLHFEKHDNIVQILNQFVENSYGMDKTYSLKMLLHVYKYDSSKLKCENLENISICLEKLVKMNLYDKYTLHFCQLDNAEKFQQLVYIMEYIDINHCKDLKVWKRLDNLLDLTKNLPYLKEKLNNHITTHRYHWKSFYNLPRFLKNSHFF
ncbi:hypothetical protein A3Q56_04477 [Intoshia linei]|uniref:Uncharacterized protein n=1 Tax=Intoshia linei TaxID=1819745 RepID=A0A177B0F4_9BILA|nr:hypothetical protein A3Q56_04477 [Intoshia linei]